MAGQQLQTLTQVIEAVLRTEQPEARDAGAAALMLIYAKNIDEGGDVAKLGPALLASMEALHLTPRARALAARGVKTSAATAAPASPLDELRVRRGRKSAG